MTRSAAALLVALCSLGLPTIARAQRTIAQDTLSDSTPVAVTCGFCAGEGYGVIFRDLPAPLAGIAPDDFPLALRTVQLALASATIGGTAPSYDCQGSIAGGSVTATVSIWAGVTPPSGSIRTMPLDGEWAPDETLVWGADVPIELSVPDADGSSRYMLTLVSIPIADETGGTLIVSSPATYLRVVVVLPPGGSSTLCDDAMLPAPGGVPVRDEAGPIAPERDFLYASGYGFLWNEAAPGGGIAGDWAIRLQIVPAMHAGDGGVSDVDAGADDASAGDDAGASDVDAGETIDAGHATAAGGGCSCRAAGAGRGSSALAALALLALLAGTLARRRAR